MPLEKACSNKKDKRTKMLLNTFNPGLGFTKFYYQDFI
jgi:hypothetical protein